MEASYMAAVPASQEIQVEGLWADIVLEDRLSHWECLTKDLHEDPLCHHEVKHRYGIKKKPPAEST